MQTISYANIKSTKSFYDFNSILKFFNILLCIFTIYLYSIKGANEYVNTFTIILAIIITSENIGMLFYEKRRSNPFIIILVFITTVFYTARITTLVGIPISETFLRDSITFDDLNYALIFIFFCNASIFLGLYISKALNVKNINLIKTAYSPRKTRNLLVILSVAILLVIMGSMGFNFGGVVDFFVVTFFHSEVIYLFTFAFIAYHYENIPKLIRWLVILLILLFIFFVTIAGSRSGILTAGYLLLISNLVVKQRIRVSKTIVLSSLMLIPISVLLYIVSTFNRDLEIKETNAVNLFRLIKEENVFDGEKGNFFLGKIYQRIGFLDYTTSLIKNRENFSKVINPVYYTKSIIDNVLTPGFDIFNITKASHTLGPLARGEVMPTRIEAAEMYNSDMMGVYGEYYVMFFGYPALAVIFFLAFIFQRIYDTLGINSLPDNLYKVLVVTIFFTWVNSFGTDWIVIEFVTTICTAFFLKSFYYTHTKKREYYIL